MALRTALGRALALVAVLACSTTVQAQIFRAYLASDGSDVNPCTLPQPCRLLPAALAAVASGGEIWMLDSANYNTGPVIVDKSVSIMAVPGAVGSAVAAANGPAFKIMASGLKVALRNLVIGPFPGSIASGIEMTGTSTLTIENSLIANLDQIGIHVSGAGTVRIANSIIRNCGFNAVFLQGGASAEVSGTQLHGNNAGIEISSSGVEINQASVTDSVISGGQTGFRANTIAPGAIARIFVTRCTVENVGTALMAFANAPGIALLSVSASMIVRNSFAWNQNGTGSVIESSGNNHIRGNNGAPTGTLTLVGLQ